MPHILIYIILKFSGIAITLNYEIFLRIRPDIEEDYRLYPTRSDPIFSDSHIPLMMAFLKSMTD